MLHEINAINNYVLSLAINGLTKIVDDVEADKKEIEKLSQDANDPFNKLMLEYYELKDLKRRTSDPQKQILLNKAMREKLFEAKKVFDVEQGNEVVNEILNNK